MRELKDFSPNEWLTLMPLKHAFKQMRDIAVLAVYRRIRLGNLHTFLRETERYKDKNIALVVAFEQPWALDWLLHMAAKNLTDTTVLVFDNSRRPEARLEIERVCQKHQTPYLGLPMNPTRHVNRSHGMAMTWIFYNVVRAIRPRLFGFIDHDMIPVRATGFADRLGDQPFFGFLRVGKWAWNLWAGYCQFDFASVAALPMNFLHDFSRGLDTGGRNWTCLYKHHDWRQLNFAGSRNIEVRIPSTGESHLVQVVDERWIHIGGIGYNENFKSKAQTCQDLAQAFNEGITWEQLTDDTGVIS